MQVFQSGQQRACCLFSLRKLSLSYAVIDEDFVINLTHCCSGIEILELDKCTFWFEFLELSVFPRLKKASFLKTYDWLSDTIFDHTGLESFKCDARTTCEFTAAAYGSIRELILSSECSVSPSSLFENLTNTFPLLEEAELSIKFDSIDRFEASNHHLRELSFSIPKDVQLKEIYIDCPKLEWLKLDCCGLKKVYINCPSLRQLLYIGDAMPAFPLSNSSAALKVIHFQVGVFAYFISLWFMHLRGLIKQMALVGRVIHLNLSCSPEMVEFIPLEFGAFQASKQSDVHLRFGIAVRNLNFKNPSGLIDGLIWSTCPTTLTFVGTCYELVKDLCDKSTKKPQNESCEEFCNKCWWHYIVDFEVESLLTIEDIKENLPAFLKMYRECPLKPRCTFKLYWCCNEGCQDYLRDVQQTSTSQGHFGKYKGVFWGLW